MNLLKNELKKNAKCAHVLTDSETSKLRNFVYLRMPAFVMRVKVELTNKYRDPLQEALLGLLSTPATVTTLSADLGIEQQSIIERALEELVYAGLVEKKIKGIFTLSENDSDAGILKRHNGWVVWDVSLNCFLPQLILDINYETIMNLHTKAIPTSTLSEILEPTFHSPSSHNPDLKNLLLHSIGRDDFCIYSLKDDKITKIHDQIVSVSFTLNTPAFTYDIVPVEIQPGITSASELFFFAPMSCVIDEHSNFEYMPKLRDIILNKIPDAWKWLERKAQEVNNEFLDSINSEALKNLGGKDKLLQVAQEAVTQEFLGIDLKDKFKTEDLMTAAQEAEKFFIFYNNEVTSKIAVRRSYEIILQQFASNLGDIMSKALKSSKIKNSLNQILKQKKNNDLSDKKLREAEKESIKQKASALGIDIGPWILHSHTYNKKALEKTIAAIDNKNQIHQIGAAFTLWLLPIIIDDDYEEIKQLKSWLKQSFKYLNNLMYIVDATTKQRNVDMKLGNTENGMPVAEIRSNIYRIWKAIGNKE